MAPSKPAHVSITFPKDESSAYSAPDGRTWTIQPQEARQGTTRNWAFIPAGSPAQPWTERLGFAVAVDWVPRAEFERRIQTARSVDPEMQYSIVDLGPDDFLLLSAIPLFKERAVARFFRRGTETISVAYSQRIEAPAQLERWTQLLKSAKIVPPAVRP